MSDDPVKETPMAELDRDNVVNQEPKEPKPPPPMDGNGKTETITDNVRKARDMIPVGDRGVNPQTYAQWIDIAKDVCKAHLMLPMHLHDNPPVMAGLLEIAARFQLSAYMLASQTYVQNNRLCFQAQAFGAIVYASGLLRGRLRFEFHGEGENVTCTVSGRFKDEPDAIYSATTPTLKQLHPGTMTKENKDGVKQTFVKGSPLWDKDPEQQLAYFAERRWIRRYAPDACMGMYTREEVAELDEFRANRGDTIALTADRLGQLDTGEGWGEGAHVDADLASIGPEWPAEELPLESEPEIAPEPPRPARRKPKEAKKPARRAKMAPPPRKGRPGPSRRPVPPSKATIREAVKRAELPPKRAPAMPPKWLDYVSKSDVWIRTVTNPEQAEKRWDDERDLRDRLTVPMGERSRLRAMLDRKLAQLRPKLKENEE